MANTHKFIGNHATEVAGVMREPGEAFSLTKEQTDDHHVQDMIETELLIGLGNDTVSKKGGEN